MSKVITQQMPVYGKIFVGNRDYYLLEPEPVRYGNNTWAQNGVLKFYVKNGMDFACYLLVHGDFFIDTFYDGEREVKFTVDENDDNDIVLSDDRIINALNEVQS